MKKRININNIKFSHKDSMGIGHAVVSGRLMQLLKEDYPEKFYFQDTSFNLKRDYLLYYSVSGFFGTMGIKTKRDIYYGWGI